MTTQRIRTVAAVALSLACVTGTWNTLLAQESARRTRIAVVRFKSSQETPERKYIVNDLSPNLSAAIKATGRLDVPDDALVAKAIGDEGLRPDGLLNLDKCINVGKDLKSDYVVAGSAILKGLKWHACVRVLSVQSKKLLTTEDVEYSVDEMNLLYGVLASQIVSAVETPPKADSSRPDFKWKGEFLLSFGKHRIDIEPPILLAINSDPPFELSVVAEMAVAKGSHAVTNFEVFVDNMGLGTIHGALAPPVPVKEREWIIGGRAYLFTLELNTMRVFTVRSDDKDRNFLVARPTDEESKYVTSALFSVAVRPKEKE